MAKKKVKEPIIKPPTPPPSLPIAPPPPPLPPKEPYSLGEVYTNPYLDTRITEILDGEDKRAGWVWVQRGGRVIVSPHLGVYVWYDEYGNKWTTEAGALWLTKERG